MRSIGIRHVIYLDKPPLAGSKQRETFGVHSHSSGSSGGAGILSKLPKVFSDCRPNINSCYQFQIHDTKSPTGEGSGSEAADDDNVEKEASARSCPTSADRDAAALLAVCPAPLHYCCLQHLKDKALKRLRYVDQHILESTSGPTLAVTKSLDVEQSAGAGSRSEYNRDGCFKERLGSIGVMTGSCWSRDFHINILEMMAAFFASQAFTKHLQGTRILLTLIVWGKRGLLSISEGALVTSKDNGNSTTPPRSRECHSRLSSQTHIGQDRVDVWSQYVPLHRQLDGPTAGRSICYCFTKQHPRFYS